MTNEPDRNRKHAAASGRAMGSVWVVAAIVIAMAVVAASYWSDHGGPLTQSSNPAPKNATTGSGSAAR